MATADVAYRVDDERLRSMIHDAVAAALARSDLEWAVLDAAEQWATPAAGVYNLDTAAALDDALTAAVKALRDSRGAVK
jgi:hypothetical protein